MHRRILIAGSLAQMLLPCMAVAQSDHDADDDYDNSNSDQYFVDYFSDNNLASGTAPCPEIKNTKNIIESMPQSDPYGIMLWLSNLQPVGGKQFNRQWTGNSANPLIVYMLHMCGLTTGRCPSDTVWWCAAAVSCCLRWGGYQYPENPSWTGSYRLKEIFDNGTFMKVSKPIRGDICVFQDADNPEHGHVGFWSPTWKNKPFKSDQEIAVLGGNQGEPLPSVSVQPIHKVPQPHDKNRLNFLFYIRPLVKKSYGAIDLCVFDKPCGGPQCEGKFDNTNPL